MTSTNGKSVTVGLIADTHMPRWCKEIPASVFDLFADVDLILHAGDVGELRVLDILSQIAPVIAVHGNDEHPPLSQKALPFLQTVALAGQRIVLTHGHYPDVEQEMKARATDSWHPKLHDYAAYAKEYGASIVVTGHTHIPLMTQYEGIWLINPGAVSPGNDMIQQKLRSVARLVLTSDGSFKVEYFDVENPAKPFQPQVDIDAGFIAARNEVQDSAFARDFEPIAPWIGKHVLPICREPVVNLALHLAREYRAGKIPRITAAMVMQAMQSSETIPAAVIEKMREHPDLARFIT
jgi:uncharacterized protein